jgi:hypothetical protein
MRPYSFIISILFVLLLNSCIEVDKTRPYISGLKINGLSGDTVYTGIGDLDITYSISDNITIKESRVKVQQQDNLDSGFFYLAIQAVNAKYFDGQNAVSIPDSIRSDSKLFKVSIDAYDTYGNQAFPVVSVINFK